MATETASRPASDGRGIRFSDRVFVDGPTTSGKSTLINHLAASFRCQVVLYDTKDEFSVPGVTPVHSPEALDWNERLIHLIDDRGDLRETDRFFQTVWQRKAGRTEHKHAYGLIVVVHELGDICGDEPAATPRWVSVVIRKGAAHKIGLIYGSQRPRNIPRVARTEAMHTISMVPGLDPEDMPVVARMHGMNVREFEAALAQAAQLGDHAGIWFDKRAGRNVILPPLSPEQLRNTIAHGIDAPGHYAPERAELRSSPESSGEVPELSGAHDDTMGDDR